ncbi:MAG: hypothetical protein LBJ76_01960 [Candidatus Accumulibacter sp.]|jgi:hypothetical protein|nr:hypothetical protein [Accumulibacter sp.]
MELNSISPNAGSSLLSAVNPNLQQERLVARRTESEPQAQEARQPQRALQQAPQEAQASRQGQDIRQPSETEAADRVQDDQRTRPTVNAEGQLVGRRINITA